MQGNGTHGVSVKEAAQALNITPRAVRFRLKKNQLVGSFIGGEWVVFLGETPEVHTPDTREETEHYRATNGNGTAPAVTPPFQAIMAEWIGPLTEKIAVQAEEIGKLKAENEMLRAMSSDDAISHEHRPGFWKWFLGRNK